MVNMDSWKWFSASTNGMPELHKANYSPFLMLVSCSSLASRYALRSADCINIGSTVAEKLCLPFRDELPLNALLIVDEG